MSWLWLTTASSLFPLRVGTLNDCARWVLNHNVPLGILATVLKDDNERKMLQFSERAAIPTATVISAPPNNISGGQGASNLSSPPPVNDILKDLLSNLSQDNQMLGAQQSNPYFPTTFAAPNGVDPLLLSRLVQGARLNTPLLQNAAAFTTGNLAAFGGAMMPGAGNDSGTNSNVYARSNDSPAALLDGDQVAAMAPTGPLFQVPGAQGFPSVSRTSNALISLEDLAGGNPGDSKCLLGNNIGFDVSNQHQQSLIDEQQTPSASVRKKRIVLDHSAICLFTESDQQVMSEYQCLIRQQMEAFVATRDDVQFHKSRSMTKSVIKIGQVGIRCRHCAVLPQYSRAKGAVFYPKDLNSLYQVGQNMVQNHLLAFCKLVPDKIKSNMEKLRYERRRGRGGREHWATSAKQFGIDEDKDGLYFNE